MTMMVIVILRFYGYFLTWTVTINFNDTMKPANVRAVVDKLKNFMVHEVFVCKMERPVASIVWSLKFSRFLGPVLFEMLPVVLINKRFESEQAELTVPLMISLADTA